MAYQHAIYTNQIDIPDELYDILLKFEKTCNPSNALGSYYLKCAIENSVYIETVSFNDEIIAHCILVPDNHYSEYPSNYILDIASFEVLQEHQLNNIDTILIENMINFDKTKDTVIGVNKYGIQKHLSFYEKFGFKPESEDGFQVIMRRPSINYTTKHHIRYAPKIKFIRNVKKQR